MLNIVITYKNFQLVADVKLFLFQIREIVASSTYRRFIGSVRHWLFISEWIWSSWQTCNCFLWKMVSRTWNRFRKGELKFFFYRKRLEENRVCCQRNFKWLNNILFYFTGSVIFDTIIRSIGERRLCYRIFPLININQQLPITELA